MRFINKTYEQVLKTYTRLYCVIHPKISIGKDVVIYPGTKISFRYSGDNSRLNIRGVELVAYQVDIR